MNLPIFFAKSTPRFMIDRPQVRSIIIEFDHITIVSQDLNSEEDFGQGSEVHIDVVSYGD